MKIVERAIRAAEIEFWVNRDDLLGPSKRGFFTIARFAVYEALRQRGMSYSEIGRQLNGRDHGTIIHGCRRAKYLLDKEDWFAEKFQRVLKMVDGRD